MYSLKDASYPLDKIYEYKIFNDSVEFLFYRMSEKVYLKGEKFKYLTELVDDLNKGRFE